MEQRETKWWRIQKKKKKRNENIKHRHIMNNDIYVIEISR